MNRAELVAPDGVSMMIESKVAGSKVGYTLDRKFFDRELVWQAAEAGADVRVKTRASAPIMEGAVVKGAVLDVCGSKKKVYADLTIAARTGSSPSLPAGAGWTPRFPSARS